MLSNPLSSCHQSPEGFTFSLPAFARLPVCHLPSQLHHRWAARQFRGRCSFTTMILWEDGHQISLETRTDLGFTFPQLQRLNEPEGGWENKTKPGSLWMRQKGSKAANLFYLASKGSKLGVQSRRWRLLGQMCTTCWPGAAGLLLLLYCGFDCFQWILS